MMLPYVLHAQIISPGVTCFAACILLYFYYNVFPANSHQAVNNIWEAADNASIHPLIWLWTPFQALDVWVSGLQEIAQLRNRMGKLEIGSKAVEFTSTRHLHPPFAEGPAPSFYMPSICRPAVADLQANRTVCFEIA